MVFSPSSLADCHRRTALTKKYDWYLNVDSALKMERGSIYHEGLSHEQAPPGTLGVVRELHLSTEIETSSGPQIFHGTFDELTLLRIENVGHTDIPDEHVLHVKLLDYKSTGAIGHDFPEQPSPGVLEPRRDNVYQINAYAYLVRQAFPAWFNGCMGYGNPPDNCGGHLFPNTDTFPRIDRVEVDELSIMYFDMKRARMFTSLGIGTDRGKMKGEMVNGHWHRSKPTEYEELELLPIHQFASDYMERHIRRGIEEKIEGETILAPPLAGDRANMMCRSCAVLEQCIEIGEEEGYDMSLQGGML